MSTQNTLLNALGVKERFNENYTSNQLLSVLDDALFYAVGAIIRNTTWFNLVLSNVVTWYCDNTRRKISSTAESRNDVFSTLISVMLSDDPEYQIETLRSLQLERSLWFKSCKMFVSNCPEITGHYHNFLFKKREGGSLHVARRDALYWITIAEEMKKAIMEKYMRHVGTQAVHAKKKNPEIDLEDTVQNFTISLSQAIDKCSSDRGTLTTYINQWFLSAKTRSRSEEYGTAYVIPDSVRKEFFNGRPSNIYVPFQDLMREGSDDIIPVVCNDPSNDVEDECYNSHLLKLAKHADPKGYGRFYLGLAEIAPTV